MLLLEVNRHKNSVVEKKKVFYAKTSNPNKHFIAGGTRGKSEFWNEKLNWENRSLLPISSSWAEGGYFKPFSYNWLLGTSILLGGEDHGLPWEQEIHFLNMAKISVSLGWFYPLSSTNANFPVLHSCPSFFDSPESTCRPSMTSPPLCERGLYQQLFS